MAVTTSLGTTISVVAGAPATYDEAGFGALTFVQAGEVTELGEFGGEAEVLTHTPIDTGIVNKFIGPIDYGALSLSMGRDLSDAGQALLKEGFDGTEKGNTHSFEVEYFDGGIEYFTGIITSYTSNVGSASNVRNASCNVALNNKVVVVDPV